MARRKVRRAQMGRKVSLGAFGVAQKVSLWSKRDLECFGDDLAISLKLGGFLGELTKCALVIGWARRQGGAYWLCSK